MKKFALGLALGLGAMMVMGTVHTARAADGYEAFVVEGEGGAKLPCRLLKPKDYDANKKYPLVLFLHGAGERGDDNQAQLKHVCGNFLKDENREKYPCFVLAPQCPNGKKWAEVDWGAKTHTMPEKPAISLALAMQEIEKLQKDYSIDAKRIYITGLSMGGYGTWDAIARYPEKFAAASPMCGGGDEATAAKIAKLPIWVFHGDQDGAVPVARSRNMVAALKKAGGEPKYSEYPGVGHDVWTQASSDPAFLAWMFAQKRD